MAGFSDWLSKILESGSRSKTLVFVCAGVATVGAGYWYLNRPVEEERREPPNEIVQREEPLPPTPAPAPAPVPEPVIARPPGVPVAILPVTRRISSTLSQFTGDQLSLMILSLTVSVATYFVAFIVMFGPAALTPLTTPLGWGTLGALVASNFNEKVGGYSVEKESESRQLISLPTSPAPVGQRRALPSSEYPAAAGAPQHVSNAAAVAEEPNAVSSSVSTVEVESEPVSETVAESVVSDTNLVKNVPDDGIDDPRSVRKFPVRRLDMNIDEDASQLASSDDVPTGVAPTPAAPRSSGVSGKDDSYWLEDSLMKLCAFIDTFRVKSDYSRAYDLVSAAYSLCMQNINTNDTNFSSLSKKLISLIPESSRSIAPVSSFPSPSFIPNDPSIRRLQVALSPLRWRYSSICSSKGGLIIRGKEAGDAYEVYGRGHEAALAALAVSDEDGMAHKFAAILYSYVAKNMNEKIANAYKIRDHALKAISLCPQDPIVHHVLGVWCYEVANLGWISRKAAAVAFGEPPNSTNEEAVKHLLKAEEEATRIEKGIAAGDATALLHSQVFNITGPWMTNRLKLGQAYKAMGRKDEARKWVKLCRSMPVGASEDPTAMKQAEDLEKSL